jgi:hypothetical protein
MESIVPFDNENLTCICNTEMSSAGRCADICEQIHRSFHAQKVLQELYEQVLQEEAETEEEAEGTLVERSEAADLATAEAQGIIEIDACGWTKQTWCATKASLAIWKDFDDVYVRCMAECFSEE